MALTAQAALRKDKLGGYGLQHRHFAAIAAIIADYPHHATRQSMAEHFAAKLGDTNPKFDADRFIRACLSQEEA